MTLAAATIALALAKPPCAVDLNANGQADIYDWLTFAAWYFAGDMRADGSGSVERNDAGAYIAEWLEGCK